MGQQCSLQHHRAATGKNIPNPEDMTVDTAAREANHKLTL